ncbi:MAG: hypothetical protein HVK28_04685, partial [Pelagibacteraceae bacterium]|nr:hypothetical protein [Pelagibacteraceae bacterium]
MKNLFKIIYQIFKRNDHCSSRYCFINLGITGSSIWQKEKIIRMKLNDETSIYNYNIVFKEVSEVMGPNYVALQGNFWVYNNKKN